MRADDKRRIAHERVRKSLIEAFLELLETKRFSQITVSELAERAGVSRESYYRNYNSMEAIVDSIFERIHAEAIAKAEAQQITSFGYDLVLVILEVLHKHRIEIVTLNENGFVGENLMIINDYLERISGTMPCSSIERYLPSLFAGSLYSVVLQWLQDGARESCEEMADFICSHCSVDALTVEFERQ